MQEETRAPTHGESVTLPLSDANNRAAEVLILRDALTMLYDLLEDYAPTWYTDEHRNKVEAALRFNRPSPP
jgi:hypothetical protein